MSLFGGGSSATQAATSSTQGDTSKDVEVANPPEDSISDLSFSSAANLLAVSSWDKKVRIYEINNNGEATGKNYFEMGDAVLSCAWSKDGTKLVAAGADRSAMMVDLKASQGVQLQGAKVAQHEDTIRCVKMWQFNGNDMVVTGSWDKTVKYWDPRDSSGTPAGIIQCPNRVYTMDTRDNLLVVGTAERQIQVINLSKPQDVYKTISSPLKWQTRVVSCFTDATGFAVGSIEGRCAIQYVEDKDVGLNFSFKCHRQQDTSQRDVAKVYSVNAISFHPVHGTFSTAGSDGTFHFWDKDAKHRLKGYPEVGGSITATAFNNNGQIFAYAVSYDWSKGYAFNTPQYPTKIKLHPVIGDECKPRPGSKKR